MSFTSGSAGKYYHTYRHFKRLGYNKTDAIDLIQSFSFTRVAEYLAKAQTKVGKRAVANAIEKILENKRQLNFTVNKEQYEMVNRVLRQHGAKQSEFGRWENSTDAFVSAMSKIDRPKLKAVG